MSGACVRKKDEVKLHSRIIPFGIQTLKGLCSLLENDEASEEFEIVNERYPTSTEVVSNGDRHSHGYVYDSRTEDYMEMINTRIQCALQRDCGQMRQYTLNWTEIIKHGHYFTDTIPVFPTNEKTVLLENQNETPGDPEKLISKGAQPDEAV